jgi:hypothetical protein
MKLVLMLPTLQLYPNCYQAQMRRSSSYTCLTQNPIRFVLCSSLLDDPVMSHARTGMPHTIPPRAVHVACSGKGKHSITPSFSDPLKNLSQKPVENMHNKCFNYMYEDTDRTCLVKFETVKFERRCGLLLVLFRWLLRGLFTLRL